MTTRPIVISRGLALAALVASAVAMAGAATASAAPGFVAGERLSAKPVLSAVGPVRTAMASDGTAFVTWIEDGTPAVARVAVRAPGGTWVKQTIAPALGMGASTLGGGVPIGVAADGTATVIVNDPTPAAGIRVAVRPPGGSFGPANTISTEGRRYEAQTLAVSPNGNAVVGWLESADNGSTWRPTVRVRDGANWYGVPKDLIAGSTDQGVLSAMSVAINDAGRAAVGFVTNDGSFQRARAAIRPAGAAFGTATTLNTEAKTSGMVDVAVSPAGAVAAGFSVLNGTALQGELKVAPATSTTFGPRLMLHTPASKLIATAGPVVVAAPADEAFHVAFSQSPIGATDPTNPQSRVAVGTALPSGGSWVFVPPGPVSPTSDQTTMHDLAVNARGDRLVLWRDQTTLSVRGAFAPAGSTVFGPAQSVPSDGASSTALPTASFDPAGNAVAAWLALSTSGIAVYAAGFDAAPPTLSNVLIPPTAQATFPAAFSATASDVWSAPTVSWNFGDGATADGASASHAYGTPNPYTATVTATDAVGNSTSQSGGVSVSLGDRDRDGVLSDRDCDEGNAGIRPGQRDIPGNGIDENCDGADAAWATLATTIRFDWIRTRRGLRVTALGARGIKAGDVIVVRCSGRGCKRKKATVTVKRTPKSAAVSLNTAAKGATLRSGAKLTVEVSRQDYASRITTWTVRPGKGPKQSVRCRIPGAKKTQTCA